MFAPFVLGFLAGLCFAAAIFYWWFRSTKPTKEESSSSLTLYCLTQAALAQMPSDCREITVKFKVPDSGKSNGEAEMSIRYGKERPGLLPTMPISSRWCTTLSWKILDAFDFWVKLFPYQINDTAFSFVHLVLMLKENLTTAGTRWVGLRGSYNEGL